ncbi:hypothetical protein RIF29_28437 [Crotalaria pallida]|uniref:Uncharacterized protein n=1 Tax=Crotalaria pallida TaxID=3830 RepID=A0AAN9EES8_CROPI
MVGRLDAPNWDEYPKIRDVEGWMVEDELDDDQDDDSMDISETSEIMDFEEDALDVHVPIIFLPFISCFNYIL